MKVLVIIFQKKDIRAIGSTTNKLTLENYEPVYAFPTKEVDLEDIFRRGNFELPLKYPISVGDIVAIARSGRILEAYSCEPVGWRKIEKWLIAC